MGILDSIKKMFSGGGQPDAGASNNTSQETAQPAQPAMENEENQAPSAEDEQNL